VTMKSKKGYYTISVVAGIFRITAQTLRIYEEKGLISPGRSEGNKRLYTDADLDRIELILRLTRELGVNLAGVEVVLNMRDKMMDMEKKFQEMVESLFNEFQNAMKKMNTPEKEGLIPMNQHNLMRIIKKMKITKDYFRDSESVTTIEII